MVGAFPVIVETCCGGVGLGHVFWELFSTQFDIIRVFGSRLPLPYTSFLCT